MRIPWMCTVLAVLVLAAAPARSAEPETSQADVDASPAGEVTLQKSGTPTVKVARMTVCQDVVDRVPVGEGENFPRDVGQLYCFTRIETADPPAEVFHRWYVGDRMINEIPINVKGPRWRCWSIKTIYPGWKGDCRVEILTEEGDVLATVPFTLE